MVALPAESPAIPLQTGLHTLLSADATLDALVAGIFDGPPENVDGDYITIDESAETPDNTHGGFGSTTLWTLGIWTKARGHRQGLLIEARVRELLDHQKAALDAVVAGHKVVAIRFASRQSLIDPEPPGDTRHMAVIYRIDTEQEPGS